ncbi:MAG: hypothetical protein RL499_112 [Actinomycetota bacterium]|jgi:hypothetical protein
MTPEQIELIRRVTGLPNVNPISHSEFLRAMGAPDGVELGISLLATAIARQDPHAVEYSLLVCHVFGFTEAHLPLLHELATSDWHFDHEDVAWELDQIGSDESIPYLKHLAKWVPEHLLWDDARALSTKAVWGIGKMGSPSAYAALFELAESDDPHVIKAAKFQLERLGLVDSGKMKEEQKILILEALGLVKGEGNSHAHFLEAMGAKSGFDLGLSLLMQAAERQDESAVLFSLAVCKLFGYGPEHLPLLHELSTADWHVEHEEVASALGLIGSDSSIPYLKLLAEWVPGDVSRDHARTLASKALWSIGNMGTPAAHAALVDLAQSNDPHVVRAANVEIQRLGLAT